MEQRPGPIRLLKIDVEGAEAAVVQGMTALLASSPPDYIVCETVWGQSTHNQLCAAGYVPRRLESSGDYGNILYVRSELA